MGIFDYDRTKAWRDGVRLCSVRGEMNAELLMAKLRAEGIPSEKRYVGAGNYMTFILGQDFANDIDIYVPEASLEDAKNIIIPIDLSDCTVDAPETEPPGN